MRRNLVIGSQRWPGLIKRAQKMASTDHPIVLARLRIQVTRWSRYITEPGRLTLSNRPSWPIEMNPNSTGGFSNETAQHAMGFGRRWSARWSV